MWWFGKDSGIWILKIWYLCILSFRESWFVWLQIQYKSWILIQETQFFTECWARGSSGWNISGCRWMFVGIWEIYTWTSKLVPTVNFVISVKLEWKIVSFLPAPNSCFSKWNIVYYKTLVFFHKLLLLAAGYENNQSSTSVAAVKT